MLKNIPLIISPDLLKYLSEMGHGDDLVIADANFPACTCGAKYVVRADGSDAAEMLNAVLALFPLDTFVKQPVTLMQVVAGDDYVPIAWEDFKKTLLRHGVQEAHIGYEERFRFYERASRAYCVIATGERQRYANLILKKGVVEPNE